jgi:hypothetical protein
MSHQQFVYGEFNDNKCVSKAVSSLVEHGIEPDEIDVQAVHPDGKERIAVVHQQPVAFGLMFGLFVGLIAGLVVGGHMAGQAGAPDLHGMIVMRWTVAVAMIGAIVGGVAGLGFWRTRVDLRGRARQAGTFIVGTTVLEDRSDEMKALLSRCHPIRIDERAIGGSEMEERRDEREVLPRI